MKKAFIYKIQNLENGKLYIGSTSRPVKRKHEHFAALRKNCHHSSYLQNSWNKYGEEMFEFSIIDECEIGLQFTLEKEWVIKEKSHLSEWGYNMAVPTEDGGYTCTDYHKEVLRKKSTINATKQWEENRKSGKYQVVVIDLETKQEEYYDCKADTPYIFKNKNFNFAEKKFQTTTYNKTKEQIQKEFDKCVIRYNKYKNSQFNGSGISDRKRKVYKYEFVLWEDGVKHIFNTVDGVADYLDIHKWTVYKLANQDYFLFNKYTIQKEGVFDQSYKRVKLDKKYNLTKSLVEKVLRGDAKTHKGFSFKKEPISLKITINKGLVYKTDL